MKELNNIIQEHLLEAKRKADTEYEKAVIRWKKRVEDEEESFERRLKDPESNRQLGLPEKLPAFTIKVLKKTQAMNSLFGKEPKRVDFYKKYGLA